MFSIGRICLVKAKYPLQSVAAAGVLALLTLSVFMVSHGRGPASVVQRYHRGLLERNSAALDRVTVQPRTQAHGVLESQVLQLLSQSQNVELGRVATRGKVAAAQVVYSSPLFGLSIVTFAFRQDSAGWVIDPSETLSQTRESSRF